MNNIPFLNLAPAHHPIKSQLLEAFERVYDRQWFVLGDELDAFETAYALFSNTRFAIGVSNGLDALRLCLTTLDVGPGDEVIVPANTFIATALAVIQTGANPIFVDPDPYTYCLTADQIGQHITPRTKAVIPVHLYGQACNMPEIMSIAEINNVMVVEDNAQAHGASFAGRLTGSWGAINATSFYPGKNLGALGDAGGLTTNSDQLADKARTLRNYGAKIKYTHSMCGFNMRMDECQAAMLSIKLKYLSAWTSERQMIAGLYDHGLGDIEQIGIPFIDPRGSSVHHLYVIQAERRDELKAFLLEQGIHTSIHYPVPLHLEGIFSSFSRRNGACPNAERHAATCLSLPLWVGMTEGNIEMICSAIKSFYHG